VACFCLHANEPSGSTKYGEFLGYLCFQARLCFMDLVKRNYICSSDFRTFHI
jgi:hypothetical protein